MTSLSPKNRTSESRTRKSRPLVGLVGAAVLLVGSSAFAQYDDDAPAAPPPAPKPAAPKPAPRPPAPRPAAPKPAAPAAAAPKPAAPKPAAAKPEPAKPEAAKSEAAKPEAAKPAGSAKPKKPGDMKLPGWHPPVQPPKRRPNPPRRKGQRDALRKQLEALRKQAQARKQAQGGPPAKPKKPTIPKDAHGFCPGHGIDQRPEDINLVHGWLGADNEQAVPRPRGIPPHDPEKGWWGNFQAQSAYWKWRFTPYPYRYENKDDTCDPRNQPIPLLANIVNLAALLLLLSRFGKKPIAEGLKKRRDDIMREIDEAKAIRKKARARLSEYEGELENLDGKLEAMREQYKAEGELDEKRARDEAAEAHERMMADAAFRISQEEKTLQEELSREALEGALSAAEKLLGTAVSKADHDRLAEEFLDQIADALSDDAVAKREDKS